MAYVYRHIRLDKNQPFYIGIGSDSTYKRAYSTKNRNKHWKSIIFLTSYNIEIVLDDLTWEEACEKEKEFIELYGRHDKGEGPLCNYTDGGEGAYGRIPSFDTRKKISQSVSGKNHGMYGRGHDINSRKKISESQYKKVLDTVTGKIYKSILDAANAFGLRPNTLSRKLSGVRNNNTSLKYL